MSGKGKNYDKPVVPVEEQIRRILTKMSDGQPLSTAHMGYTAFPENRFHMPQGAALAVARTLNRMWTEKLVGGAAGSYGYVITDTGRKWLQENPA